MARLAIRATGDKSRRENVTTGNSVLETRIYHKNMQVLFVNFDIQHDILHINVGDSRNNYLCKSISLCDKIRETHRAQ